MFFVESNDGDFFLSLGREVRETYELFHDINFSLSSVPSLVLADGKSRMVTISPGPVRMSPAETDRAVTRFPSMGAEVQVLPCARQSASVCELE